MPRRKGRGKGGPPNSTEMQNALADLEKDVEAAQRDLRKAREALKTVPKCVAQKPAPNLFEQQVKLLESMKASCTGSVSMRSEMMQRTVEDIETTRGRLLDTALPDAERDRLNERLRARLEEAKKIPGDLDTAVRTLKTTWKQRLSRLHQIDPVKAAPLVAENKDQMTEWLLHATLTQERLHKTVARLEADRASSGFYLGNKLRAGTQW